jgi:hypothetical protein
METLTKHSYLGIPAIIWILQFLYVAIALGMFALISAKYSDTAHRLPFQIGYVMLMIAVNIIWRVAIRRFRPGWF